MRYVAGLMMLAVGFALVGCGSGGDSEAVGTWVLDKDALLDSAVDMAKKQLPEGQELSAEQEQQIRAQAKGSMEKMTARLEVDSDGTYQAHTEMGGQKSDSKGTWKLEGKKLTFTTTEEDGKEKKDPEVQTATLENDRIYVADDEMPFEIVMKRQ